MLVFVGVALGLCGLYRLLFALHARGWLPFDPSSDLLGAARGYTLALAAIVTALALSGREGLAVLWKRVTKWPSRCADAARVLIHFRSISMFSLVPLLETAIMMPRPIAITTPITVQVVPMVARTPNFHNAARRD